MRRSWAPAAIVVVAAALAACAALGGRAPDADLLHVTLLQINDHNVLEPVDGGRRGGMARLATLVRDLKRENPNTIFALAGDTISPSVESALLKGAQMVAALNAVGLDFAAFGNHEFDFGPEVLVERMKESKFRWLAANVVDRRSGRPFGGASADVLVTLGGARVGLFGLTTPQAAETSRPGPDVAFGQPVAVAKDVAARLRAQGASIVVAVTHVTMAEDKAIAAAADVDVILGGHEHEPLVAEEGKTLITKAGSDARYLVQVDVWLTRDGRLVERSWRFREVSRRIEPDPAVEALVRDYRRRLDRELDAVVGKSAVPLEARSAALRTEESNLGDFVLSGARLVWDPRLAPGRRIVDVSVGGKRSLTTPATPSRCPAIWFAAGTATPSSREQRPSSRLRAPAGLPGSARRDRGTRLDRSGGRRPHRPGRALTAAYPLNCSSRSVSLCDLWPMRLSTYPQKSTTRNSAGGVRSRNRVRL
jgi:5'-nucleotidase